MLLWMQIHILNGASVTRIFKMNNIFYIHYTKSPRVKHDFKKKNKQGNSSSYCLPDPIF